MVSLALSPSLRLASCCKVEVVGCIGRAGGLLLVVGDNAAASQQPLAQHAAHLLIGNGILPRSVLCSSKSRPVASTAADQRRLEAMVGLVRAFVEQRLQVPVLAGDKRRSRSP